MGLIARFKQLFNKTICIFPHQRNDMVSFVKLRNGMIKIGAEILIDENFNLIIVHYNKVCDVLKCGTYKVDEVNTPKLFKYSKAFNTNRGIYTPKTIKADAYYVNLKSFRLNTFKTPERIIVYNNDEKIKIKLEGTFTLRVVDSEKLMKALCNDYAIISNRKAMKEIKATIGFDVSKILNAEAFALDDYLNHKEKIADVLNNKINKYIKVYGIEASEFFINTVILPKKKIFDKSKEEVLKQENNIDIIKLVEERLNDIENSFAKVERESSSQKEKELTGLNKSNTTIDKQGDVRIDVSNIGQKYSEPIFSMPYSNVPNTEMYGNANQKEPQLFEEVQNEASENLDQDNNAEKDIEENLKCKKLNNNSKSNIIEKADNNEEKVVNEIINYFANTKEKIRDKNLKNLNNHKVKVGKEKAEGVLNYANIKTKVCKNCGVFIEEDAKFCSKCGKSTEELVVCACCGAKNFSDAKKCCVCKSDL